MEVDGLGARCALSSCNTLDYLPFRCAQCALQFCAEHKDPAAHRCRVAAARPSTIPVCPLCAAPVPVPAHMTPDAAVSRHIDQGCPKRARKAPVCAAAGCSVRDLSATTCPSCRRVFCLAHRLEADHACTRTAARPGVDPFGRRAPAPPPRPSAAKKTPPRPKRAAASAPRRTDFANVPSAPVGDPKVPADERITVAVFFPAGSGVQARYMYFSARNSAGKIMDGLVKDVQGLSPARGGERYCLYAVKRGGGGVNLLPHITPLHNLGAGVVQTGDMLVMEVGADGLDPAWLAALQKLSSTSRLPSRRSVKVGKSSKCIVA